MEKETYKIFTKTLADLYLKQGLKDKARQIYEKLLEKHPNDEHLKKRIRLTYSSEQGEKKSPMERWNERFISLHAEDRAMILGKKRDHLVQSGRGTTKPGETFQDRRREKVEKTIALLKKWLERLNS